MMAKPVTEAKVATLSTVVMMFVMPDRFSRQWLSPQKEIPDKQRGCNSSHRP